jgi:hypothetical protein
MIDFDRLAAPFGPSKVSWRIGSTTEKDGKSRGMALAYLDARDVMDRLDDVVGPEGWQCDYPHAGAKTVCRLGLLLDGQWVWKADGAGDTDVEAEKGALSDAFKRAAVRWGIGRYLYDIKSPWVELEGSGKFKKIAGHEYAKLEGLLKAYRPNVRPMTVAHMLSEIAACAGEIQALETLKAEEAFRIGYRAASRDDKAKIMAALNPVAEATA